MFHFPSNSAKYIRYLTNIYDRILTGIQKCEDFLTCLKEITDAADGGGGAGFFLRMVERTELDPFRGKSIFNKSADNLRHEAGDDWTEWRGLGCGEAFTAGVFDLEINIFVCRQYNNYEYF